MNTLVAYSRFLVFGDIFATSLLIIIFLYCLISFLTHFPVIINVFLNLQIRIVSLRNP